MINPYLFNLQILDKLSVGSAAAYGLRRLTNNYRDNAIRVRRSSDNLEANIPFTASGALDVDALLNHCQTPRRPLDVVTGAAAAYSTRLVRSNYSGACMRVRRNVDNLETDIGFDSDGNLNITALMNHCLTPIRPLDSVSSSAVAYGLRRLRSAYNGAAIKVRNSSNLELDIYFTASGDLDTSTLLSFAGSGSAFVTTWYDQSGNGKHATQTTAINQPRIVNSGVLDALNNRAAVRLTGNAWMNFTNNSSQPTTVNSVVRLNSVVANAHITDGSQVTPRTLLGVLARNWVSFAGSIGTGQPYTVGSSTVLTATFNGASSVITQNGVNTFINPGTQGMTNQRLGAGIGGVTPVGMNGWIQEFVVLNSSITTSDRLLLERSQSAYFGITYISPVSAFVTTWYDQSGGARNATQTLAASQPRIVNSGVVEMSSGRPAVYTTAGMSMSNAGAFLVTGNGDRVLNAVLNRQSGGLFSVWTGTHSSNQAFGIDLGYPNTYTPYTYGVGDLTSVAIAANTPAVLTASRASGTSSGFVNGNALSTNSEAINTLASPGIGIGVRPDTYVSSGWYSEVIYFSTAISTTDRQSLERSQAAYFGITHANPVSGFVKTWYDQSGNSRNAVQTTAANQPRIVNSGVVEMLNGKPSIFMANASLSTFATITTSEATVCTVASKPSLLGLLSQYRTFGLSGAFEGLKKWFTPANDGSLRYDGGFTAGSALPITPLVRSSIRTTTSALDCRNGALAISSTESLPNISGVISFNPILTIDQDLTCEAVLFTSALSNSDRQLLERDQGTYYSIPVI